jgi:hypothetical protein
MGLKLGYRRTWAEIGHLAYFHLLSELVDFNLLHPKQVIEGRLHEFFDTTNALLEPKPRPTSWVSDALMPPIGGPIEAWTKASDAKKHQFAFDLAIPDGFVVLFEYSDFAGHGWKEEKETRVCLLEIEDPSERFQFKYNEDQSIRFPVLSSFGYPTEVSGISRLGNTLVGGCDYTLRTGPNRWFAVSPGFAKSFNLFPARDEPFVWFDARGEVVAYTVAWRDGPGRRSAPRHEDVFAKGWLVILRRTHFPGDKRFLIHRYIRREHTDNQVMTHHVSTHSDHVTFSR